MGVVNFFFRFKCIMSIVLFLYIKLVSIEKDVCCVYYLCEGEVLDIFCVVDGEWMV